MTPSRDATVSGYQLTEVGVSLICVDEALDKLQELYQNVSNLPQPVGRQKEVLCLQAHGHHVVLGTAGSGKTTLALLRALYLSDCKTDHGGKTLLVTFSKCLVAYLHGLADVDHRYVDIRNYHHFARGYLSSRKKMRYNSICGPDTTRSLCDKVLADKRHSNSSIELLKKPVEFFVEEFEWMAKNGITTLEEYASATRVGRAEFRVQRSERPLVFELQQEYLKERSSINKDYDWHDLGLAVLMELSQDSSTRMYRHVIIDEGQDLSPMEIRSLAAAVATNGSLTFFGDVAQQIYGRRVSWRKAGLDISHVWNFEENYRNTRSIADLALALANKHFNSEADIVVPKSPTADGPKPSLVKFSDPKQEMAYVVKLAKQYGAIGTVAVLFRSREQEAAFSAAIRSPTTRLHRDLGLWPDGNGIFHGTFHAAKGLEFDSVVIPHLSSQLFPDQDEVKIYGEPEAIADDARLLYVGITRARMNLVLTFTGNPSSVIPHTKSLYDIAIR